MINGIKIRLLKKITHKKRRSGIKQVKRGRKEVKSLLVNLYIFTVDQKEEVLCAMFSRLLFYLFALAA